MFALTLLFLFSTPREELTVDLKVNTRTEFTIGSPSATIIRSDTRHAPGLTAPGPTVPEPTVLNPTVADTIQAGEVFITNLPDSIDGIASTAYTGIALPSRSWLRNRTFFWKTNDSDRGDHALWFYVFREPEFATPADSIAIHVVVR